MIFNPIDWNEYNEPPFFPQWLSRGETLDFAKFDDGLRADLNRVQNQLAEQYDLDKVKGVLLDRIGKMLAQPRKGLSDDAYPSMLKLKAMINNSTGTVNEIIQIIEYIYNTPDVIVEPNYPAGISIRHSGDEGFDHSLNKKVAAAIPAGIGYTIRELFSFIEQMVMSDDVKVKAIREDRDVYPAGLRYDGRINYDHGQLLKYDGQFCYDGSVTYDVALLSCITVNDTIHIPSYFDGTWKLQGDRTYSGDTLLYSPEEIDNPATFNARMRDELVIRMKMNRLEDTAGIIPYYDGRLMYQGWNFGEGNPSMIDPSMQIKVTKHFAFDGRWKYWVQQFDGSFQYDGSLEYSSGVTYSGHKTTMEEVI